MGEALRRQPAPRRRATGLNGIPLRTLPSWIAPQARANRRYRNPSFPQRHHAGPVQAASASPQTGSRSRAIGAPSQVKALQTGYDAGRAQVNKKVSLDSASPKPPTTGATSTAGSGITPNTPEGTPPIRAALTIYGGANLPQDALYAQINNLDGTSAAPSSTATTPTSRHLRLAGYQPGDVAVVWTVPPTVNDRQGNRRALPSMTVTPSPMPRSPATR